MAKGFLNDLCSNPQEQASTFIGLEYAEAFYPDKRENGSMTALMGTH